VPVQDETSATALTVYEYLLHEYAVSEQRASELVASNLRLLWSEARDPKRRYPRPTFAVGDDIAEIAKLRFAPGPGCWRRKGC
jgi:hypothetical protein